MFKPAHDVPNYSALVFCYDESFGKCVVGIEKEVGCVVFREAHSVYVHDGIEIGRREAAEAVVLDQQLSYSKNPCGPPIFDIILTL